MSEPMYEVTETSDLAGIAEAFPNARKVTVDVANKTLFVFSGRGNRATRVSGVEFDRLVKTLPAAGEGGQDAGETPASQGAAKSKRGKAAE
ncbi:hypothetical protein [Candidatus Promineifilum breve]|nr:hypothetical protein [Candidatus Promineifilum breve]